MNARFAATIALAFSLLAFSPLAMTQVEAQVVITERLQPYTIRGNTIAKLASQMSRRGPYSSARGQRAWATASRNMKFDLETRRDGGQCTARNVRVSMAIVTRLPRLAGRLPNSQMRRWTQMLTLLQQHENVHVGFYRQLARRVHRSLTKMPPQASCRTLQSHAKETVRVLSERDRARNARFEARDRRNYRRMVRLFNGS